MAFQDDYILRTIENLVTAIGRLALGKDEVGYYLEADDHKGDQVAEKYRKLMTMVEKGDINEAENLLFEEVPYEDLSYLEMALSFYRYLNEYNDDYLFSNGYSREEIVDGINAIAREFGISGFENFVDTKMV